ncbi:MAG: ATP-binding protein [Candidatus Algichlamydia australiensis]|nr:ATP-binding protein [Chlamydiales bacterium]
MKKKTEVIGRQEEKEILDRFFQSNSPEFMAIYGRRRVGKTYLVKNYFTQKSCHFFKVTGIHKGTMSQQLAEFSNGIGSSFFYGTKIKGKNNWFDAFEVLTQSIQKQIPRKKKVVLFFDEFPWMATPKSKLLQALEYYWNHYWSEDNRIKLIICGSAVSWIIKNIIHNKGGLHNRLTRTILLEPMSLRESKNLLHSMGIKLNNQQVAQLYMVTGGIPYYLSHVPAGLSDTQIIERLAFTKNGLFLTEFDKLYSSLFENAAFYIDIVKAIASQRYGIDQKTLFEKIKKISGGGTISKKLKELEEAGFIISFVPYKNRRKGIFYKVIDEFTLFYLYWIEPIKKTLLKKGTRKGYWDKTRQTSSWSSWAGYAYEALCYKHLFQISEALELSPTALPSTWQYIPKKGSEELGAQIDLLYDRDDGVTTICEIKFTKEPFAINKDYAKRLQNKMEIFQKRTKTQKQLFLAIVSAKGLKKTMYSEEIVDAVVSLSDLFK